MKKRVSSNICYEICEKLGSGVTSEVYRAFQVDTEGWTRQEVALKVLHSKKDIQIMRQEFQRLVRVRSKYCVKVLNWDTIHGQQALVLEFIDGKSLYQLKEKPGFSQDLVFEVVAQIYQGLEDLHSQGLCHGDLNFHNVMIDTNGCIKLIDFGNEDPISGDQLTTPEFASSKRLRGAPCEPQDDYDSLEKMATQLLGKAFSFQKLPASSSSKRRQLTDLIRPQEWNGVTCLISPCKAVAEKRFFQPWIMGAVGFFLTLFLCGVQGSEPAMARISIHSDQWFHYAVNGVPQGYGPVQEKSLRPGNYRVQVKKAYGEEEIHASLVGEKIFLLQPPSETLR